MQYNRIGITTIRKTHRLTCHCEGVELELDLPEGVVEPRRCNCSFCKRRGAIAGSISEDNLRIVKGSEHLRLYQFGTHVSEHYFCGICGIYTHHRRRSDPRFFGYNVGCLEDVNPYDLNEVPISDGMNHVCDRI
jgi:hypothetical protein